MKIKHINIMTRRNRVTPVTMDIYNSSGARAVRNDWTLPVYDSRGNQIAIRAQEIPDEAVGRATQVAGVIRSSDSGYMRYTPPAMAGEAPTDGERIAAFPRLYSVSGNVVPSSPFETIYEDFPPPGDVPP